MTTNLNYINTLQTFEKEQDTKNCEEFAISLLKKYGSTLYILLNFEGINDDEKIGALLSKIVEKSCLKINSPEAYKAKPAIFSSAYQVIQEIKSQNSYPIKPKSYSPLITTNPYIHTLLSLSFEKRFAYILKIQDNLTYRELETVLSLHRAEISTLLTEAREQIRLILSTKKLLPFNQRALLCSITYQHLSPYLDNELNILYTIDIQNHLKDCDDCLKILADHQYIEKQLENLPKIPEEKLTNIYLRALHLKEKNNLTSHNSKITPNDKITHSQDAHKKPYHNLFYKLLSYLTSLIKKTW